MVYPQKVWVSQWETLLSPQLSAASAYAETLGSVSMLQDVQDWLLLRRISSSGELRIIISIYVCL